MTFGVIFYLSVYYTAHGQHALGYAGVAEYYLRQYLQILKPDNNSSKLHHYNLLFMAYFQILKVKTLNLRILAGKRICS